MALVYLKNNWTQSPLDLPKEPATDTSIELSMMTLWLTDPRKSYRAFSMRLTAPDSGGLLPPRFTRSTSPTVAREL